MYIVLDRILINHQQQTSHLTGGNPTGSTDGMIVQHHTLHGLQQNAHQVHLILYLFLNN